MQIMEDSQLRIATRNRIVRGITFYRNEFEVEFESPNISVLFSNFFFFCQKGADLNTWLTS